MSLPSGIASMPFAGNGSLIEWKSKWRTRFVCDFYLFVCFFCLLFWLVSMFVCLFFLLAFLVGFYVCLSVFFACFSGWFLCLFVCFFCLLFWLVFMFVCLFFLLAFLVGFYVCLAVFFSCFYSKKCFLNKVNPATSLYNEDKPNLKSCYLFMVSMHKFL